MAVEGRYLHTGQAPPLPATVWLARWGGLTNSPLPFECMCVCAWACGYVHSFLKKTLHTKRVGRDGGRSVAYLCACNVSSIRGCGDPRGRGRARPGGFLGLSPFRGV
ncbi:unnamed protein product [Boreogadus saida]